MVTSIIFVIQICLLLSTSSSYVSWSESRQPGPLQLPEAGEHFTLCFFLYVHVKVWQSVLPVGAHQELEVSQSVLADAPHYL